jgi:hypothetical protein
MKRIAILAALALVLVLVLVVGVGGAAEAACVATNCAIEEQQRATSPAQGGKGAYGATTPRLEKDLKELENATEHALPGPCTGGSNCTTQTKSPTPAAPCTGNNC